MSKKFFVITKTPLRISFFGGGTDFEDFYKLDYGRVIATTINKFIYVTVKNHDPLFKENFRLNYSETEKVSSLGDIQNNIIRECLKLVKIKPPIYISVVSDIPSHSGLGSSSSLTVGLLNALYCIKGIRKTPNQLAKLACKIEIDKLKQPIGKQDQYIAANGGFLDIKFSKNNKIKIRKIRDKRILKKIFKNSVLVWTGQYREAKSILKEQKLKIKKNLTKLRLLNKISTQVISLILKKNFDIKKFCFLLDKSWHVKKGLSNKISSNSNDIFYNLCKNYGAAGGKLLGAGGGGFFFLVYNNFNRLRFLNFIKKFYTPKCLPFEKGTEVIYKEISKK